ncbi:MAG: hypothetical protein DRO99_01325 [Candidatus Aenigmatarchaeota archaeon]|nr:MAG: hypothetical protein DRO99_01325 [Candidatus Aenigmarchaeota archaeon]
MLEDYVKFSVEHGADIIVFPELLGCWLSATPVGLPRWLLKLEAALVKAYIGTVDSPILVAFGTSKLEIAKASDVIALAPYGQVGMLLCTDSECQWRALEA